MLLPPQLQVCVLSVSQDGGGGGGVANETDQVIPMLIRTFSIRRLTG